MAITYVKSDELTVAAGATESIEVDLGLGIDEAARIMAVEIALRSDPAVFAGQLTGVYSFDPEDTVIDLADDEQFIMSHMSPNFAGAAYGLVPSWVDYFDFSGLNLITARNLRFLVSSVITVGVGVGRVFYEKYKPTITDLTQLIAQRR
ncbi:hypothetical protein ES708_32166 [subsurface metagenome]